MATRAQFFIGDPCDVKTREWLGCVAFDGYPSGDLSALIPCDTEGMFRTVLATLMARRDDYTDRTLPRNVPAPRNRGKPKGTDSIILVFAR